MKKVSLVLMALFFVLATVSPVFAGGNDQYTVLLIQSDKVHGHQGFVDSSVGGTKHSIPNQGDVHHSTTQVNPGFGSSSIYFDGIGDYLRIDDSNNWNFSNQNFTIDFWMYNENPTQYLYIIDQWKNAGGSDRSWAIFTQNGVLRTYYRNSEGAAIINLSSSASISPNTWYHIGIVRDGSNAYLFVNGKQSDVQTNVSGTITDSSNPLTIGCYDDGFSSFFQGYLDEIRISKGIARWTSDFTPPTEPYDDTPATTPLEISSVSAIPISGLDPLDVSFTISGTGGTEPYTFAWDFGDGSNSTDQNPSHMYTSPGIYSAQITITDADGNTVTDSISVSVQSGIAISSTSAIPVSGLAPLNVDFTISATGGTEPYTYAWDFGDTSTSTDQNPSHTYTSPGAFSASVTVTDSDGNTATESVVVTVQSDASACASHAVFDSSTKILTMPYLDVPLIDPISQQEIPGSEAVFSCTMKYVNHSGGSFSIKDITYLPNETGDDCHAIYNYDGTIYIPNVDVTTVIALPWGNIIEGPVETYQVTLKQLMLDNKYYHLQNALLK